MEEGWNVAGKKRSKKTSHSSGFVRPKPVPEHVWVNVFSESDRRIYGLMRKVHPRPLSPEQILGRLIKVDRRITLQIIWKSLDSKHMFDYIRWCDNYTWGLRTVNIEPAEGPRVEETQRETTAVY